MPWTAFERLIADQDGVIRRDQLVAQNISRDHVRAQLAAHRWMSRTSTVLTTFTGTPTVAQCRWIAVLHGGSDALLGGIAAAEMAGLRNWQRDELDVVIPVQCNPGAPRPIGVHYIRSRHVLDGLRSQGVGVPRLRLEPAVLIWASRQRSTGTVEGILAACVQQRLTDPHQLTEWLDRLSPLRKAPLMRETLIRINGGAQSKAEIDLGRLCKRFAIQPPLRQVRRRDARGRNRYTDAEWRTLDGRTLILEVDGGFHWDAEQWEDDIARQRALTSPGVVLVRCTDVEARDGAAVAADLIRLGVPRVA